MFRFWALTFIYLSVIAIAGEYVKAVPIAVDAARISLTMFLLLFFSAILLGLTRKF